MISNAIESARVVTSADAVPHLSLSLPMLRSCIALTDAVTNAQAHHRLARYSAAIERHRIEPLFVAVGDRFHLPSPTILAALRHVLTRFCRDG